MQTFEYKVVPAPNRPKRVKGVKGTAGRFAAVLTETMNEQAADGWEYLRSDSMPVEEKLGLLKSRVETYQTVLIFRRATAGALQTPMAGYIEDQSDVIAQTPEPETATEDVAQDTAPEAEPHFEPDVEPEVRAEPTVSSEWAENIEYAQDPPLTSQADDSPFAQPETVDEANLSKR